MLFIKQFTTSSNYRKNNRENDTTLLKQIEKRASKLGCDKVWEALSVEHPYREELNPDFDVFGFYRTQDYTINTDKLVYWKPSEDISIPCYLIRKKI